MKNLCLLFIALLLAANTCFGQTNATDFTATDCSGASHNLFTELGQSKVVVLVWVMPCATCINDAKGAYEAVQSYATANPGKVLYYLIDDNGGTSCATLTNWANTNGIKQNVTIFRNQGEVIDEDDFGGTGMPHVVVVGPDKKIYLNEKDGQNNRAAIQEAIGKALLATSVSEDLPENRNVAVYPNPASDKLLVNYSLSSASEVNYEVYNTLGERILTTGSGHKPAGNNQLAIDVNGFGDGIYILKISTGKETFLTRFLVAQ
ncbi:MAG: T9SS type A sorting domain-containing protein [Bacteroidia bacterium]